MPVNLTVVPPECKHKWPWAFYLGFCVRDSYDIADFVFGFMSLLIWIFALLPQIVQSYQTKSVESQSIGFWILWVIGDVTNLIGCFLTHQIMTNTLLAAFYSFSSVVILGQWFYYTYYYKRRTVQINDSNKKAAKKTGMVCGALCFLTLAPNSLFSSSFFPMDERRRLLHVTPSGRDVLGETLGWVMAFIYIISRAPQLYKSVTTKEVEDLSVYMFICTFAGNLCQLLSMVIKHVRELNGEYFVRNAPWMINAALCALQDLIIVFLISKYGKKDDLQRTQELQPLLTPDKVLSLAGSNYKETTPRSKNSMPGGGTTEYIQYKNEG